MARLRSKDEVDEEVRSSTRSRFDLENSVNGDGRGLGAARMRSRDGDLAAMTKSASIVCHGGGECRSSTSSIEGCVTMERMIEGLDHVDKLIEVVSGFGGIGEGSSGVTMTTRAAVAAREGDRRRQRKIGSQMRGQVLG